MRSRVFFLFRFYVLTVLVFIIAKVVFMLFNYDEGNFTATDMVAVVWNGLTLDLSTALYFLILPFLLTIVCIWVKMPRWPMLLYEGLVAIAFALAFMSDTSLYPFWHFKLDVSCLQYLETPTEAMASVSFGYLLIRFIGLIGLIGLIGASYIWFTGHPASGRGHWWEALIYMAMLPVFVIGIRGGLGESTTNIGQVYFSQNQFLNHSAVNPVFSFFASFEKTASYVPDYHFMDETTREEIMAGLYPTESVDSDSLLNTSRPNVVIILMESCGGMFTELGGRADVMPRLSRLMHEGVSFDRCYGNSWRTDRGTVCTLSGYPSFPTSSVMKMPSKTRLLPNIAQTLAAQGYETSYIYGGDINFTNMRSYLVAGGFSRLTWMADYSRTEQETSEWGVRDDITFQTLFNQIQQYTADNKSFLIGFSTLSSHEPWDVPLQQFDDEILNSFYYLDDCIGRLVDQLKPTPAWQNLLIVLLPDHSIDYNGLGEHDASRNLIPMVWTGGAVKAPRRITTICNQTDLPATLLGQMGIRHDNYRFSRDVMSCCYYKPFAIHTFNNGISMIDSTGFAVYDLDVNRIVVDEGSDGERLISMGKAILQTATEDLKGMRDEKSVQ